MGKFVNDLFLQDFSRRLNTEIKKYREIKATRDEMFEQQKKQLQRLYDLENDFRDALRNSPKGELAMVMFCDFIKNVKRNTLSARPYFKERSVLMGDVGPAIKRDDAKELYKYHMNFNLIKYMVTQAGVTEKKFLKLYEAIKRVRNEILICNLPLAINRAKIFYAKTPQSHLEYMDMIQISVGGLYCAIDKYVPPFTHSFKDVLIGRIVGEEIENFSIDQNTQLLPIDSTPKSIKDFKPGDRILGCNSFGDLIETEIVRLHDHGILEGFEVVFDDGYKIVCTENHKFLTSYGMVPIKEIVNTGLGVLYAPEENRKWLDVQMRFGVSVNEKEVQTCGFMSKMPSAGSSIPFGSSQESPSISHEAIGLDYPVRSDFINTSENVFPLQDVPGVPKIKENESYFPYDPNQFESEANRWMDQSLWGAICFEEGFLGSSEELHGMPIGYSDRSGGSYQKVAPKESGQNQVQYGASECQVSGDEREQSGIKGELGSENIGNPQKESKYRKTQESMVGNQEVKNGGMVKKKQGFDMGFDAYNMSKYQKTSGLCLRQPKNLDRSGRDLSFSRSIQKEASATEYTTSGSDVTGRMFTSPGCDVTSAGNGVFRQFNGQDETEMVGSSVSNAPLTQTGDLLFRKVVSYRPVGSRKMYDLEVAHERHNFLLPNGIVTSNSQTMLHFFPYDKKKLYNANKIAYKFRDKEIDYHALTEELNKTGILGEKVEVHEIADIMMASSCVSVDANKKPNNPTLNESNADEQLSADRFADTEHKNPEETLMHTTSKRSMYQALEHLPVLFSKILRLKGLLDEDL